MNQQKTETRFVVCVQNTQCGDLELRKLYQVLPDEAAIADGHLRIIDESGEDYLYPAQYFLPLELSQEAQAALLTTA
jgi:hypothetical protein